MPWAMPMLAFYGLLALSRPMSELPSLHATPTTGAGFCNLKLGPIWLRLHSEATPLAVTQVPPQCQQYTLRSAPGVTGTGTHWQALRHWHSLRLQCQCSELQSLRVPLAVQCTQARTHHWQGRSG